MKLLFNIMFFFSIVLSSFSLPFNFRYDIMKPSNKPVPTYKLGTYLQVSVKVSVMAKKRIEEADFDQTGYSYTLSLIAGKYKPVILYCLMEYEPVRFNEMQRYLKRVADKTLSQNLKELEADGLIIRTVYPQIPPKVEYSLTERGHSLVKVLDGLCDWGNENRT